MQACRQEIQRYVWKKQGRLSTWSVDDVGSQEFGPLLLVALLCDVTCKCQK